jgi:phosphoglycolate phosphatase
MAATPINGNPEAQVWLFDFDNTLAALEKQVDWAASRRELEAFLRSEGIDESLFKEFPSRNLPLYNALLTRLCGAPSEGSALVQHASEIIESFELRGVSDAAPLPGAKELLLALRALDKRVAIVTSNSSRTISHWLNLHGLTPHIGAIVGRDSLLPLKPSPEMIRRALELSDSEALEAVVVGDSEADLLAARRAKIGFFGVGAHPDARARLEALGACHVFAAPTDLARHLAF